MHIPYRVWPVARRTDGLMALRAIDPDDIESVRIWRNAQMDILRQRDPISKDAQLRYFSDHVWPQKASSQPQQILLAIEMDGGLIGYGGLVHISWPDLRAEVSFLLAPSVEAAPERSDIFLRFLRLVQIIAFGDLGLCRLFTETYAMRSRHIAVLEFAGMKREGRLRDHVTIDGRRADSLIHGILSREWEAAK